MNIPFQISTRKVKLSRSAVQIIKSKVQKLEKFCDKIIACKVLVETPHRHKIHGSQFRVSINISIPGADVAVKKETSDDLYIAIRDAFDAAKRQIIHFNRKHKNYYAPRSSLKSNSSPTDIDLEEDYETSDQIFSHYSLNAPWGGVKAA